MAAVPRTGRPDRALLRLEPEAEEEGSELGASVMLVFPPLPPFPLPPPPGFAAPPFPPMVMLTAPPTVGGTAVLSIGTVDGYPTVMDLAPLSSSAAAVELKYARILSASIRSSSLKRVFLLLWLPKTSELLLLRFIPQASMTREGAWSGARLRARVLLALVREMGPVALAAAARWSGVEVLL